MKAKFLITAIAAIALVSCKKQTEEVSGGSDKVEEGVTQVVEAAAEAAPAEPAVEEPAVEAPATPAPAVEAPATPAPAVEAPATPAAE